MNVRTTVLRLLLPLTCLLAVACGDDDIGRVDSTVPDTGPEEFRCLTETDQACDGTVHITCNPNGEFLTQDRKDCADDDQICIGLNDVWCAACRPDAIFCDGDKVVACASDGSEAVVQRVCKIEDGEVCNNGTCKSLCEVAIEEQSYVGCEFYGVDLDNAAIAVGRDASSQPFAIVVSNPSALPTDVFVEINTAVVGAEPVIEEVESVTLLPGDLEVFRLPRREVDGASSNAQCFPDNRDCPGTEVCLCSQADSEPPCFCRNTAESSGLNDGTHTAITSNAYRIRSQLPIIAYQFNPLDNVGVFSNDASMLIPTSAISANYSVVGWPQTIADADCNPNDPACRAIDFDLANDGEDLRAFMTVVGTQAETQVDIKLGADAFFVLGDGADIAPSGPGDTVSVTLGAFDVLNLETAGLNSDFTGSIVSATSPVSVFVGSEASDAPRFTDYANRQCCADHLEDQLFGDEVLGGSFMIARMPPRTVALNDAFLDPTQDSVGEVNEPEWVRILAVSPGQTVVNTTLPVPDDRFTLEQGEWAILRADQDFLMNTDMGRPLAVLQALPSQQALGIPNYYPGGDPAIVAIPPIEQYRKDYVFLTPDKYAFDFVVITANRNTEIQLDGEALSPLRCTTSPADGIERLAGDPPPEQVIHRCQLSFPEVSVLCNPGDPACDPDAGGGGGTRNRGVRDGEQNDGVHRLLANEPIGVVVYGFDAFVSYAYAAGLNLKPIAR